ncbi:hypothetical protein V6N13_115290 [Hibiscus sabdariffa]
MDETKRMEQVQHLLALVNKVTEQNGGQPYSDELFLSEVESKLKEATMKLARKHAEMEAQFAQKTSNDEIRKLEKAQRENEEFQRKAAENKCTIL